MWFYLTQFGAVVPEVQKFSLVWGKMGKVRRRK
jgi:hypothetical protein